MAAGSANGASVGSFLCVYRLLVVVRGLHRVRVRMCVGLRSVAALVVDALMTLSVMVVVPRVLLVNCRR